MQMKQMSNSILPPQIASATKTPVTDPEKVGILSVVCSGVFPTKDKKAFFATTFACRPNILAYASTLDKCSVTTNLSKLLDNILHQKTSDFSKSSKAWKNTKLTSLFLKLHPPFEKMLKHIREQMRIESSARKSIQSRITHFDKERNPVVSVLEQMEEVMRKVELAVIEGRTTDLYAAYMKVKLTGKQRTRLWQEERVPSGPNLSTCVMCGHSSTNLPVENNGIIKFNTEALTKFKKDTKLWDEYVCKKAKSDPSAVKPSHLNSCPHKRQLKEPIIQCMCATSFCLSIRNNNMNGCPIKCLKLA